MKCILYRVTWFVWLVVYFFTADLPRDLRGEQEENLEEIKQSQGYMKQLQMFQKVDNGGEPIFKVVLEC